MKDFDIVENLIQENFEELCLPNEKDLDLVERAMNGEYSVVCNRCDGEGYIERYKHIKSGICFKCWGSGHLVRRRILI